MGKPHSNLEALNVAIIDHEVELIKIAVGVLQVAGKHIDVAEYVSSYLHHLGYSWHPLERGWYKDTKPPRSTEPSELLTLDKLAGFKADPLLRKRADVVPWHELPHIIWLYNFAHRSEKGGSIDVIAYLDGIARSRNLAWDEEKERYVRMI